MALDNTNYNKKAPATKEFEGNNFRIPGQQIQRHLPPKCPGGLYLACYGDRKEPSTDGKSYEKEQEMPSEMEAERLQEPHRWKWSWSPGGQWL